MSSRSFFFWTTLADEQHTFYELRRATDAAEVLAEPLKVCCSPAHGQEKTAGAIAFVDTRPWECDMSDLEPVTMPKALYEIVEEKHAERAVSWSCVGAAASCQMGPRVDLEIDI